jgi:hypothetical protein
LPEIELPPGKYRWRRPLSKPLAWAYVALGVGMLGWTYWNRGALHTDTLFGLTAVVAIATGLVLAGILRDVD